MLLETKEQVKTKGPMTTKIATGVGVGIIVVFAAVMGGIFYFANSL